MPPPTLPAPAYPVYANTPGTNAYTQAHPAPAQDSLIPTAPQTPPTYNFQGNVGTPGAAENFFSKNQGAFTAPTQAGSYWSQQSPTFAAPGQGDQFWNQAQGMFNTQKPVSNNAQGAYNQFQASAPANTDPYYSHAMDTATAHLNNAAGARGDFGSTGALQTIADSNANLLGQQAQANATYGLQRGQLAGSLASGADQSSLAGSQSQLGWMTGLGSLGLGTQNADLSRLLGGGQLAGNADQAGLAQLMGGQTAAGAAQNALGQRASDYYNRVSGLGGTEANLLGSTLGQSLGVNNQLFSAAQQGNLAAAQQNLNNSNNQTGQIGQDVGTGLMLAAMFA